MGFLSWSLGFDERPTQVHAVKGSQKKGSLRLPFPLHALLLITRYQLIEVH